jgi:hypothetical protein
MDRRKKRPGNGILLWMAGLLTAAFAGAGFSQEIRWLRVSQLQSFINEVGAEYEGEWPTYNLNFLSWPAQYGIEQNLLRQKGLWIGARNFYDTRMGDELSVKVIGSGPRNTDERVNMIFEKEIKLIGRNYHPMVSVDDQLATVLDTYDVLDSLDENLPADRMVLVRFNTSIGVSVTKKVLCFTQSDQDDYFIHDYVFKNTGIVDRDGTVHEQTLQDVWFYFVYRFAFAGESYGDASTPEGNWGAFSSAWGESTLNHAFGTDPAGADFNDPSSPLYRMRGFYSYYGPSTDRLNLLYEEDWGGPNDSEDGVMASAKFAGCVTLHADRSPSNPADDAAQPGTTWYIASDGDAVGMSANVSQYKVDYMNIRYEIMSEGHPPQAHDELIGDDYAINLSDAKRQAGGGTSQGQGYGPYTMAPGDSVRIIFAEASSGINREKNREVGWNWLQWWRQTGNPALVMPDGSLTTDHDAYKKAWVFTGRDSVLKVYRSALENYNSGYQIPRAPDPPGRFEVRSGGDRIQLSWDDNAASDPHFGGYVIYRASGTVLSPKSVYEKLFECGAADAVHAFDDTSAVRGFDYYYYILSKDDGTQTGKTLTSSLFWTLTSKPAHLLRQAESFLNQVRVIPNPYDLRSRLYQFGTESQYDRIAFYGLPKFCSLKIFTERGDLIWEKDHDNGAGDELWDSMTRSGQIVVSGIYILYVEVPDDLYADEDNYAWHDMFDEDGNRIYQKNDLLYRKGERVFRKGESISRKFIIIR